MIDPTSPDATPTDTPTGDPVSEPVVTEHRVGARSELLYWAARAGLRNVYRFWPLTDTGVRLLHGVERAFAALPAPPGMTMVSTPLGGVDTVVMTPEPAAAGEGTAGGQGAEPAATVVYLHGGAFLFCGPGTHRGISTRLATGLGVPVVVPRYRMLPEVDLQGIVEDAYAAYRDLVRSRPPGHPVVLVGDSAGSFLALKVCEWAALDGVPGPAAVVSYSPLYDLDAQLTDGPWWSRDAYMPSSTIRRAQKRWNAGVETLRGAHNVVEVDLAAFPPVLMTVAAGEMIEHGVLALTDRLRAAGRPVETHRWHHGVHAFPVLAGVTAESRDAVELTVRFLRRVLATRADSSAVGGTPAAHPATPAAG